MQSIRNTILALNSGSSSLKFGVYRSENSRIDLICEGAADEIGKEHSSFQFKAGSGEEVRKEAVALPTQEAALEHALASLNSYGIPKPDAVGHRLVHGGPHIREHQRVTPEVLRELERAVDYAPLHVPAALGILKSIDKLLRSVPQIVCLDTAFHRTMPDVSRTFAIGADARQMGIERYGFHGLSCESIIAQLDPVPERLVVAHLGNGSSVTAVRNGASVDTSMGLTPTGGVMMGTRSGDLDPGVLIFLNRHGYGTSEALEALVDHRSGLYGISGVTSDMRELLATRKENAQADLAIRMFGYQVRKTIAAMAASLGGMDGLVFTGGVGEHAHELREEICSNLSFLPAFQTHVLPAQEDLQIARIAAGILSDGAG